MTDTQTIKNGIPLISSSKTPWTDERRIGMKIYEITVTIAEVLLLLLKMTITWTYSIYEFFIPPEPKSVAGEIVLITGTGHGMGREMALRFAEFGAEVICVDINPAGNLETYNMLKNRNAKVHKYECDVTNRTAVLEMAERIRAEVGDVSILVNNAGIMPCKSVLDHTEAEVKLMYNVNTIAHIWMFQAFLPSMMERNHGHIVAMSSMAGLLGLRNLVPYCGTKSAVRGIMEALHEELREDKRNFSGINFTVIYPYMVDTGLCKNPRIKFPSLMKLIPPGEAADQILDAVRRNYGEITIPSSLYYVAKVCRAMPLKVPMHLKDFLDSGVEAE